MTGYHRVFWAACAAACTYFSARAVSRASWWQRQADACERRAGR